MSPQCPRNVLVLFILAGVLTFPLYAADPCCIITGIDVKTNMAAARQVATGQAFQFAAPNAGVTASLKVGQKIFANFGAGQVSLDGRTICCKIVNASAAAPAINRPAATPSTGPSSSAPPQRTTAPLAGAANSIQATAVTPTVLPQISAGAPQNIQGSGAQHINTGAAHGPASLSGVNQNVVHLRGIEGIEKAQIPEGAKNLLIMHAMTLPPNELDHYIVNTKLAEEWMKAHPAPASTKKHAGTTHSGCHAISMHCAGEAAKHAQGEAERQNEKLRQQAEGEWRHVSLEAAHDWKMAEDCMADKTLHLTDLPVKFSVLPAFSLSAEKDGKTNISHGSASGKVKGTVSFGVPLQGDFKARVDLFYIPCLPFAVRPKKLGAGGTMTVGTRIGAELIATGEFHQSFPIPPTGGPHIPIEIIPIVIGGVPVAELDVSLYFDGTLDLDGEGKLDTRFNLDAEHKTAFDFDCEGSGCKFNSHTVPVPSTTSEAAKIEGRVHVIPKFYAALQLDFDVDAFTARAGPQPYLYGEVYGCGAASATQSTMAATTVQTSYALTTDLDWGLELRAEALALNQKLGGFTTDLLKPPHQHLYFKDLANSSALVPGIQGTMQPAAGQTTPYRVKMPACYPYSDPIEYRAKWTGGATASNGAPSATAASATTAPPRGTSAILPNQRGTPSAAASGPCTLQATEGDCWADPTKDIVLGLAWPAPGSNSLTVNPVRDKHGRVFGGKGTEIDVNVH